ncbi:hypothetical protein SAM40697_3899 [Streptomyces ambofaciens]|uniref:Uncharacterized protein n=1 Tax=Streptomyces ambofaciens TaxID=1889 RepID=A0ABM6B2G3_STRAM|nr:hypothetical protein SAM40697_3899 [Streptomyces ambofaciens]
MDPVGWTDVRTFVVSSVERPSTVKRGRAVRGQPAVRVAAGPGELRVLAPCAYVGSAGAHPPALPSRPEHTLYEDPALRHLLCRVEPPVIDGGEWCHPVRDGRGELVGTLVRVPPRYRPLRHTWRIEQPGHPDIVGRNEWVSGDASEVAGRLVGGLIGGVLGAVADLGAEGGDQPSRPRSLEWRAEHKVVMTSVGSEEVTVHADWIDRRLAFAFALVGDRGQTPAARQGG